jgi:ADP-L-glycero-D-manno-heptose 6-epimerase
MKVVTGAAGFIGSCLVQRLNNAGFTDLILVDDFSIASKEGNLTGKKFKQQIHRNEFIAWLNATTVPIDFIFHIGARTDTTEFNEAVFERLNVQYSKDIWTYCTAKKVPLVYASSAATYGEGELGYNDDHAIIPSLKPLNPYGISKNEFDKWVLTQSSHPPFWAGLKFFNVYGPNEFHKARMASVIFHAFNQVKINGSVKLFRSHRKEYKDGWQLRDFVYVKDVVEVCLFLYQNQKHSGIYNLGSGTARSFYDLVAAVFKAMDKPVNIEFIDIPADIRDKYQYFTEANMQKLQEAGYKRAFYSLEEGVTDYVQHYLVPNCYF